MIPTILSVAAKRDRICLALHGLCLFLFQGIQQAGRFRFFWLHGYRKASAKYRKTIAVQDEDCYNKKQTECRKQKLRR